MDSGRHDPTGNAVSASFTEFPYRTQFSRWKQLTRRGLNALFGNNLVRALGSPHDILTVDVYPVWDDHYRVNVMVGANVASARIADSFFLTADAAGNILGSSPAIVRIY